MKIIAPWVSRGLKSVEGVFWVFRTRFEFPVLGDAFRVTHRGTRQSCTLTDSTLYAALNAALDYRLNYFRHGDIAYRARLQVSEEGPRVELGRSHERDHEHMGPRGKGRLRFAVSHTSESPTVVRLFWECLQEQPARGEVERVLLDALIDDLRLPLTLTDEDTRVLSHLFQFGGPVAIRETTRSLLRGLGATDLKDRGNWHHVTLPGRPPKRIQGWHNVYRYAREYARESTRSLQ